MNLQLTQVISDVVGETGQRIVRAIIGGERDGATLAKLRHGRIRASEEEIAKALEGNWREEHLFALKQSVALYDAYAVQILECDRQLEVMLGRLAHYEGDPGPSKRRTKSKNAPHFNVHQKIKSTGFSRSALAETMSLCREELPWIIGTEVILFNRLSTTLCG